jgi:hypothetical protein
LTVLIDCDQRLLSVSEQAVHTDGGNADRLHIVIASPSTCCIFVWRHPQDDVDVRVKLARF